MIITESILDQLETAIVNKVRFWFNLNNSTTRSFMFTPRSAGGLGLPHPRTVYYAEHISFYLSVLNCDDVYVRNTARDSLNFHMVKRKVANAVLGQERFGEYAVVGNILDKKGKVNCPRSQLVLKKITISMIM